MKTNLITKIALGAALVSLVACAPKNYGVVEGLDGQSTRGTQAPKQIEGLDGQTTRITLEDYENTYWPEK